MLPNNFPKRLVVLQKDERPEYGGIQNAKFLREGKPAPFKLRP